MKHVRHVRRVSEACEGYEKQELRAAYVLTFTHLKNQVILSCYCHPWQPPCAARHCAVLYVDSHGIGFATGRLRRHAKLQRDSESKFGRAKMVYVRI